MKNCSSDWKNKPFPECIKPVRFERSKQIQTNSYLPSGDFPIIDQGQSKIAGWTNDKSTVINDNLPLIVFGDHTRVFKFIDFPFAIGADGTKLIKPRDDKFCSRYFYYYLRSLNLPSKGYSRHFKLLKESEISYPEIPEQEKIAAILFKIQQAIEVQESIIEAAQELKKSTMQHVFTYGLRGEKTKETEIGRIPESWGIKLLGNLVKVKGGKRLPRGKQLLKEKTQYPYIRVCDLKNNSVAMDQLMYVPVDAQPQIKKYVINSKDIYISIAGTTGLVGIIPSELDGAQLTENAARLVLLSDPPNQKYLMRFLDSSYGQNQIESMTMKTSQPKLALARIKQIKIALPPDREQIEIASILQSIDNKIELHSAKKSTLQDLFKTMLNKLMTGEIRVKDLDIDMADVKH